MSGGERRLEQLARVEARDIRPVSQPATLYAQFAVYYAKQAVNGAKYRSGMKTDHGSKIVPLLGNLEDAIVAPVVSKANVNDPALWGNYKGK